VGLEFYFPAKRAGFGPKTQDGIPTGMKRTHFFLGPGCNPGRTDPDQPTGIGLKTPPGWDETNKPLGRFTETKKPHRAPLLWENHVYNFLKEKIHVSQLQHVTMHPNLNYQLLLDGMPEIQIETSDWDPHNINRDDILKWASNETYNNIIPCQVK
jgi:hypothetical protein